ncbi:ADYC domain-containing protein [Nannocystis radixulma]|uniref:ADYC domain-containing protein n=1 Tax=Nannocystis radixulma TaxID=2995305 RepID=A0ABT5B1I7_9BACT|nr:ADYC domain-containing protein [Nannocystis radixulma]MDC0667379.1 ADYC domain-containing protein [Nannocystis radixulma]
MITDDPGVINPRIGEKGSSCPIWQCGFNAAEVFGSSIHELHLGGQANAAGLRILKVVPGPAAAAGGHVQLDVVGDALVLRDARGAAVAGEALVGTRIVLAKKGRPYATVMIASHDRVTRWAEGSPEVDAYGLVYIDGNHIERNVCTGYHDSPRAPIALVLGGETYDLDAKEVRPDAEGWFSIACAGSAAAKLSLLGYGPQSSDTTPDQRQATLKMITADYCGGGHSYTENGTPIQWENVQGTVGLTAEPAGIEAVWTAAGALCVDQTRIADTEIECQLPRCGAYDLSDGEWITYVPMIQ